MNDEAVCRTAPATLGLLKIYFKHTIALHFPELNPQKTAKYGQQI